MKFLCWRFKKWNSNLGFVNSCLKFVFVKKILSQLSWYIFSRHYSRIITSLQERYDLLSKFNLCALSKLARSRLLITMDLVIICANFRLSRLISVLAALGHQYFFTLFLESGCRKLFRSFLLVSTAAFSSTGKLLHNSNFFLILAGTLFNPTAAIWCFVWESGVLFNFAEIRGLEVKCDLDCCSFLRKVSFFRLILRAAILYLHFEICLLALFLGI